MAQCASLVAPYLLPQSPGKSVDQAAGAWRISSGGDRRDFPSVSGLEQADGIHAAMGELAIGQKLIFAPHLRHASAYAHRGRRREALHEIPFHGSDLRSEIFDRSGRGSGVATH